MIKSGNDREYQRLLIAAIDAEMGIQRMSRARLGKLVDIPTASMDRYFNLERDLNLDKFYAIAEALGVGPGYLVDKAEEYRERIATDAIVDSQNSLTAKQKAALKARVAEVSTAYTDATRSGDADKSVAEVKSPGRRGKNAAG